MAKGSQILRLALLLLLSSGSALASDGARHQERWAEADEGLSEEVGLWRRWAHGSGVMAADVVEARQQIARDLVMEHEKYERKRDALLRRMPSEVDVAAAQITPAPALPEWLLSKRQDDGQIQALSGQIRSISEVANSFSRASQQVSQSSQQLSQSVQQLSQSTSRMSSSIQSLQQVSQQLQQSAQQAGDAARQATEQARQASESASRAISSAESSASAAIAANFASATGAAAESMRSLLNAASQSAQGIMQAASSQVRAAQADATLARADAASQVQQAQGTAVSVTQAALAVVGSIIGSSLITIGAFYLVLKLKRNRRRRSRDLGGGGSGIGRNTISYPRSDASHTPYGSESSFVRYATEKGMADPMPAAPSAVMAGANRGSLGSVQSLARPGIAIANGSPAPPVIGRPPGSRRGPGSNGSGASYALFPKTPSPGGNNNGGRTSPPNAAQQHNREVSDAPSSRYSGVGGSGPPRESVGMGMGATAKSPQNGGPSLAQWLKTGTTVSPFGTLQKRASQNWPFDKRGKVMKPNGGLPFRNS